MTQGASGSSLPLSEIEIHFHNRRHEPAFLGSVSAHSLSKLPVGSTAEVVSVDAPQGLATRLADLGFLPGTPVLCLRRAPLGDPRVYELRGVQLCLRGEDADQILVTSLPGEDADPTQVSPK